MTTTTKPWQRRYGFTSDLEVMWFIAMLGTSVGVYDTTASRVADAGLSQEAAFALGMAGILANCLSFLAIVGLLVTINHLIDPLVKRKKWSIANPAIATVMALLVTSLPVYFTALWLAGV